MQRAQSPSLGECEECNNDPFYTGRKIYVENAIEINADAFR